MFLCFCDLSFERINVKSVRIRRGAGGLSPEEVAGGSGLKKGYAACKQLCVYSKMQIKSLAVQEEKR